MNKLNSNIVKNKFNRNKSKVPEKPDFSENKTFLIGLIDKQKAEIKKVNSYLGHLNFNLRIIKSLIDEVK